MASGEAFAPQVIRCGWAKVKGSGLTSWRGWNKRWLLLCPSTLKIYEKSSSSYKEVDLNFATNIDRTQDSKAAFCLSIKSHGNRIYLSLANENELYDWFHDLYLASPLHSRFSKPSSVTHELHCVADPSSGRLLGLPDDWKLHSPVFPETLPGTRVSVLDTDSSSEDSATLTLELVDMYAQPPSPFAEVANITEDWRRLTRVGYAECLEIIDGYSPKEGTSVGSPASKKSLRWQGTIKDVPNPLSEESHVHRSSSIAKKQRMYQNLLSLLMDVISADVSGHSQITLQTVRQLFRSISSLDCVSSLIESSAYRAKLLEIWKEIADPGDPRLREALEKDETQLIQLLRAVSASKSGIQNVMSLRDERAQQFMDLIQDILDYPTLQQSDKKLSLDLLQLMSKLSKVCGRLPASLFVKGIICDEREPRFCGSFGDVFLASYQGVPVALKRMRVFTSSDPSNGEGIRQKLSREALIWQHLKHPNILPFVGVDSESFPLSQCLVSPWMKNGTVLSYLKRREGQGIARLLFEVAQGLEYLHLMNIYHGDLRGSNILVDDDGHACIADFGLAIWAESTYSYINPTTYSGSVRWMAPELLYPAAQGFARFQRTAASDVYSFACVCLELYSGRPPFADLLHDAATVLEVLSGKRPARPEGMKDEMWSLVQSCWYQNPYDRPNMSSVVQIMAINGM